jgi:hypothetical protein
MDKINVTELDINEHHSKFHNHIFKEQLQYFKSKDKKVHKTIKNMVNVMSNLNTIMCHAFIKDQALMFPPIVLLNSSKGSRNGSPLQNTQIVSDDEQGIALEFNSA